MPHTPGPWTLVSKDEAPHDKWLLIEAPDPQGSDNYDLDRLEVLVRCDDVNTDTAYASARLIAAAPDVLEALVQAKVELDILKGALLGVGAWNDPLDQSFRIMANQIAAARAKVSGESRS